MYKTQEGYTINGDGIVMLPIGTDPIILSKAGNYVCGDFKTDTMPINGSTAFLEVKIFFEYNRTWIAHYRHNNTTWRQDLYNGVLSGWKLISGEVLLWNGSLATPGEINLSKSIDMFGMLAIENSAKYTLIAPVIKDNVYLMATGAFVQADNVLFTMSAYLSKKSDKVIFLNYPPIISTIKTGVANYNYSVGLSKIIGRP